MKEVTFRLPEISTKLDALAFYIMATRQDEMAMADGSAYRLHEGPGLDDYKEICRKALAAQKRMIDSFLGLSRAELDESA